MKVQKIHFVNRVDYKNTGDYVCSPLLYYWDFFKDYTIVRHDIDSLDFNSIHKDDIVILGAGGMINVTDSFNENIEKILDSCETVIGWSIGFNSHHGFNPKQSLIASLSRFKLLGIRDYNHSSGIRYLPCVTCKLPDLEKTSSIKRKIGAIAHKDFPVNGHDIELISNSSSIDEITDFIASSETILTSSYHITYFCQLMKKKVVLINAFSEKFDSFKYPPVRNHNNIDKAKPLKNENFLMECRSLNDEFFKEVKQIIQSKIEISKTNITNFYILQNQANLSWQAYGMQNRIAQLSYENQTLRDQINDLNIRAYQLERRTRLLSFVQNKLRPVRDMILKFIR